MAAKRLALLALVEVSMLHCGIGAAAIQVRIEGLPDELLKTAHAAVVQADDGKQRLSRVQAQHRLRSGGDAIRDSLRTLGYYQAHIEAVLEVIPDGFDLRYRIDLGLPVLVSRSQVLVRGSGAQIPAVQHALKQFAPAVGQRFDHATYERSKSAIANALTEAGFMRAATVRHRVAISVRANTADIDLTWDSGPPLRFGLVTFDTAQFPQGFLERYVPWKAGSDYSPLKVLELQRNLRDTDYFSTIMVRPDLTDSASQEVPVRVELEPAKQNTYSASLFTSTDTGVGVGMSARRRWLNDRGHKAQVNAQYAQRLEDVALEYRIPRAGQSRRSLNMGASYLDENTETSVSHSVRSTLNESRQWGRFTGTLGLQFISGTFEVADQPDSSTLLYAEATLSRQEADDPVFPRRGVSYAFAARAAPAYWVSETSFAELTANARWVWPAGYRQRILAHASLGLLAVDDFSRLQPQLRFFTGGDRTVRGFDYEELGGTDSEGRVIGGRYLGVLGAEFERYFSSQWGAAVFADCGDAPLNESFKAHIGAGLGIRWRSPIGILRVDLAEPVSGEKASWHVHVVIGTDL